MAVVEAFLLCRESKPERKQREEGGGAEDRESVLGLHSFCVV